MKPPRVLLPRRTLRLGRLSVQVQAVLTGVCDLEGCAYGNSWCPNGCVEYVFVEYVFVDEPVVSGQEEPK